MATTGGEAAGGITALVLFLTGRQPVDRPTISNAQFSGDITIIKENADKIISLWDGLATLAHDNYKSPILTLASLGKLQLNAWTTSSNGAYHSSFLILYFDLADPTKIVGGTLHRSICCPDTVPVISGQLLEETITPEPGDFVLSFVIKAGSATQTYHANLALDVLADGTIDVRGGSLSGWPDGFPGNWTLEGTGNAKFVLPR
jgi:hypothetical protein